MQHSVLPDGWILPDILLLLQMAFEFPIPLRLNILQLVRGILDPVFNATEYVIDPGDVAGTVITQFQPMHTAML